MFYRDLEGNSISFDTAQTAIAIALYNLDETLAAKAVLECATTGSKNDDRLQAIMQNRQQLIEDCNRIDSSDLVNSLLQYLDSNRVLLMESSTSYAKSRTQAKLSELLKVNKVSQVYSEAIRLLITCVNTNGLIDLFMLTNESMEKLKKTILTKTFFSANGISHNVVTEGDFNAIMSDFMIFVRRYCLDQYDPSTGTPVAYLRNAFNTFFWKGENLTNAYNQINTQGLDREIGKDGYTILDTIGVEDGTSRTMDFPFLRVVSAIQDLSQDLFEHNGSEAINYDIVSLYKADKLEADYQKYTSSNSKHSYVLTFSDSMCDSTSGNQQTIRQKFNGRKLLCLRLFGLLKGPITPEVLLNKFNELIDLNSRFSVKNNVMYFSSDSKSGTGCKSNSEKYELMVRGVLALRSLLEFLESSSNRTGVTIRTLPTHIFRNRNLNSNFSTFESYVENIDSVLLLINEAAGIRPCPNNSEAAKIMNNVSIRNRVNCLFMKDSSEILKKLLKVPLSAAQQMIVVEDKEKSFNKLSVEISEIRRKRGLTIVNSNNLLYTEQELEKETSIALLKDLVSQIGQFYCVKVPVPGIDIKNSEDVQTVYLERVVQEAQAQLAGSKTMKILNIFQCCNFLNAFKILEVLASRAGTPLYEYGIKEKCTTVFQQSGELLDLFYSVMYNSCKIDFTEMCKDLTQEQRIDRMKGFDEIAQDECAKYAFLLYTISGVCGEKCKHLKVPNIDCILTENAERIDGEELDDQVSQWLFKLAVSGGYLRKTIKMLFEVLNVFVRPQNELYITRLTLSTHVKFLSLRNPTVSIKDLDAFGKKVPIPVMKTQQNEIVYNSDVVTDSLEASLEMVNLFVLRSYATLFTKFNSTADLLAVPNYSGARTMVSNQELSLLRRYSETALLYFAEIIEDNQNLHNIVISSINASFNIDRDGYCIKDDFYVTKRGKRGQTLYMHSTGYWIDITAGTDEKFLAVSQSEVTQLA